MKIKEIAELLNAEVLCCSQLTERDVSSACGSDMMSDVLAFVKDQAVLLTGLTNTQVIRTAVMMDMVCVVFVRDKQPTEEMLELARTHGIAILASPLRLYDACGILYTAGLHA